MLLDTIDKDRHLLGSLIDIRNDDRSLWLDRGFRLGLVFALSCGLARFKRAGRINGLRLRIKPRGHVEIEICWIRVGVGLGCRRLGEQDNRETRS